MKRQSAFTVIELLIVIVVIGILSTIVIISYNGLQNRAAQTTLSGDLVAATGKLESYRAENGAFPDTIAAASLKLSEGVTVQYRKDASTRGYCLTGTIKNLSRYVSDTATEPKDGGCAGHGLGGQEAVTNLVPNPRVAGGSSDGWIAWINSGSASATIGATSPCYLPNIPSSSCQMFNISMANAGATAQGGFYQGTNTSNAALVESGQQYTASVYVRLNAARMIRLGIEWMVPSPLSNISSNSGTNTTMTPNTWTRLTATGTAPAGAGLARLTVYIVSGYWQPSDTMMIGGLMMNRGGLSGYADGSASGWIWNGTAHNSTSSGPAK